MTPEQLQRAIATEDELIAEGRRMIQEAEDNLATARTMIVAAEERRETLLVLARAHGVQIPLHKHTENATDKHMPAAALKPDAPKRMGPPVRYRHALALWIKNHGTAEDLAAALTKRMRRDISASAVRSWYLDPPHGRTCPDDVQEVLADGPYFIPRSAWKNR